MPARSSRPIDVVPYPQRVRILPGASVVSRSSTLELSAHPDKKERLAAKMLDARLASAPEGRALRIRIGSLASLGNGRTGLTSAQRTYLESAGTDQAYVLSVTRSGILIVGAGPVGALYGVQTLLQLLGSEGKHRPVRNLEVMDSPAVGERYLAIPMSWYAGYGRVGFASQLWGREEWFWFVDWCLSHKVNGINVCMYGYYPFRFDEYPEAVFRDVKARTWLSEAGRETTVLYTHPHVTDEFLPELIRYANERGITVLCYWGLNTFNGGYALAHPESRYFSEDPSKFNQFRYNLCPSREDVKRYFDASVKRILELGFNGFVLEESEGSGFCECPACRKAYWVGGRDSRVALHNADHELFAHLYSVIKKRKPSAMVGIRAWRMGSETGVEALREGRRSIPEDVPIFWSNAMDASRFRGWLEVFGPERIMGQDAEALGFSALYDGLIFMFPRQYSSYVREVEPDYRPSYPQSLPSDVRQYREAAKHHCRGVTGYAFNWNGWELAPLSLAQYGWNPSAFGLREFVDHGYRHQFESEGAKVAKAVWDLPLVLETRIAEGARIVPRSDPVSGGLAGLTSLQVPTRFGEGEGEMKALKADLRRARASLELFLSVDSRTMSEQDRITLRYFENAARRTVCICLAAMDYRKALAAEREGAPTELVGPLLEGSLRWVLEDYRIVKESAFDLSEEFHDRILVAAASVSKRLARYASVNRRIC